MGPRVALHGDQQYHPTCHSPVPTHCKVSGSKAYVLSSASSKEASGLTSSSATVPRITAGSADRRTCTPSLQPFSAWLEVASLAPNILEVVELQSLVFVLEIKWIGIYNTSWLCDVRVMAYRPFKDIPLAILHLKMIWGLRCGLQIWSEMRPAPVWQHQAIRFILGELLKLKVIVTIRKHGCVTLHVLF